MDAIRKVLFPTKFENLSFQCLERLLSLRAAGLQEVVFLFVIDRDEVAFNLFSGFDKKLADSLRQEARLQFEDWGKTLEKKGIASRYVIEVGSPEAKVLEVSCREEVDLIVAGRQSRPEDAVYLGGTTMGVLRRSAIPVFVCKHPGEGGACPVPGVEVFDRVLLATDFSEPCRRAQAFVRALGEAVQRVDVIHVITDRDFQKQTPDDVRAAEAAARDQLDQVRADLVQTPGVEVEAHLVGGHTSTQVVQAVADYGSTLVVMGTTGRHGVKEMWLGSASHRVAEQAPVPVVLVPCDREECYV